MLSTKFPRSSRLYLAQRVFRQPNRVLPRITFASQTNTHKEGPPVDKKPESLRDTVNRMSGNVATDTNETEQQQQQQHDLVRTAAEYWSSFQAEIAKTWQELINSGKPKDINKKIHPIATAEGEKPYDGPLDIMVIDQAEHMTAWERMQKRLSEAPVIHDLLSRSEHIYETSGAKKVKERMDEIREDAREAWDTSQNPWVYRVSSVYDTLTAESPETVAVRELRQLDPEFTLESWRQDVVEYTLPKIMQWFLEGKINQLKPWLGESVFKRVAAEMKAREQEGVQIDTHILGIMNSEILAVEVCSSRWKW